MPVSRTITIPDDKVENAIAAIKHGCREGWRKVYEANPEWTPAQIAFPALIEQIKFWDKRIRDIEYIQNNNVTLDNDLAAVN
jgi:hypothetical protein